MSIQQISPTIRVEEARSRKEAKATASLLATLAPRYLEGGRDALGAMIRPGEPMTYIDWDGPPVWRVYREEVAGKNQKGEDVRRYVVKSEHSTEADAIEAAKKLAKG